MKNQEYYPSYSNAHATPNPAWIPDEKSAFEAAETGAKSGFIVTSTEVGKVLVHTVSGTVYLILSKQMFERQAMQQRLANNGRA